MLSGTQIDTYRTGPDLYVRERWTATMDKVWRLRVSGTTPVDFQGERLIPVATGVAYLVSAYAAATGLNILRTAVDEAPPIRIDNVYAGGNHPTVTNYVLTPPTVDGVALGVSVRSGGSLMVRETYVVNGVANITITRTFNGSGLCIFNHTTSGQMAFGLGFYGGAQAQKPYYAAGEKLKLYVPDTTVASGVDLTTNTVELRIPQSNWLDPSVAPHRYYAVVENAGVARFGWALVFDARPAMLTGNALLVSQYTKLYPIAYDPPPGTLTSPGVSYVVIGRFGTYPPNKKPV